MNTQPDISVVILCYRSGARAESFLRRVIAILDNTAPSWEVVLVGNYKEGSDDDTPDTVRRLASEMSNVKAVAMPKKGMMGWDAQSGLREASGRLICLIDGDGQMPPEDIAKVYRKIVEEGLDFVKTYRVRRDDGLLRKANSIAFNLIFRMLFPGVGLKDINSKPKIFTREAYSRMRLLADDWFFDTEMAIECARLRLRSAEVPTEFHKCTYRSSFIGLSSVFEFIGNLLRARIRSFRS